MHYIGKVKILTLFYTKFFLHQFFLHQNWCEKNGVKKIGVKKGTAGLAAYLYDVNFTF